MKKDMEKRSVQFRNDFFYLGKPLSPMWKSILFSKLTLKEKVALFINNQVRLKEATCKEYKDMEIYLVQNSKEIFFTYPQGYDGRLNKLKT